VGVQASAADRSGAASAAAIRNDRFTSFRDIESLPTMVCNGSKPANANRVLILGIPPQLAIAPGPGIALGEHLPRIIMPGTSVRGVLL
jgi:hypothetical protein